MKKVKVKKLFRGCVSVRDYIVTEAIRNNEPLQIKFDNNVMVLQPSELKEKQVDKSEILQSKFGDQKYQLIDYKWQPTKTMRLF